MNDISPGGARIHADVMPIHEGAAVQLGLPWHSGTTHNMELAWFRISAGKVRLGLKRLPKGEIHEREWQALVERALKFFEEHLKA